MDSAVAALEKKLLSEHAAAAALEKARAAAEKVLSDNAAAAAASKHLLDEQARAAAVAAEKTLLDEHARAAASLAEQVQADDALLRLHAHLIQQDAMKKLQAERAAHDAAQVRLQSEAAIMNLKAEKEAFEAEKASYAKKLQDEHDSAAAEKLRIQHAADAQHALSLQLAAAKDKLQYDQAALLLAERAESAAAASAAATAAAALHDEKMRLDRAAVSEKENEQLEKDRAIRLQQQQQQQQQHLNLSKHGIQPDGAAESILQLLPPRPRSRSRSPVGGHRHSGPAGGVVAEWVSSTTHRVLVKYNILHMFVLMLQPLCCCYALITSTTPCMLTPL